MIPVPSDALRMWLPRLLLVAGVALLGWWLHHSIDAAGYTRADLEWQAKWNKQAEAMAKAKADAVVLAREEEQRRQSEIDKVRQDAEKQIAMAESDAAAASAAADSLHEQARRLEARANQCAGNPAASQPGQATAQPGVVLADVLRRADERAGELAAAYDRSRAAGLACERAYDALLSER